MFYESAFLTLLSKSCDIYIIGGYVRNRLYGLPIKDIDCVIGKIHDPELFNTLIQDCVKNRFNGYRYYDEKYQIDFWEFDKTFNLPSGIQIQHPSEILNYVFFNMDAILYDCQLNCFLKHPEYIKFEETKTIDILYYPNDFLEKQRQKVLRYSQYFSVSQKTCDYLKIGR